MSDRKHQNVGGDAEHQIGDSLEQVVRSLTGASATAVTGVFAGWERIVGERVAAHARPLGLDDGRLIIGVDEPGWATELRYLEADLVRNATAVLGPDVVRSVDVRVTPMK